MSQCRTLPALCGQSFTFSPICLGGLCRNAVPSLPSMRWKSIAASLDTETVVVCGGINFLGELKDVLNVFDNKD